MPLLLLPPQPPPGQPTGCIDLQVTADDVSVLVFSNSDVALSSLGKNGSQSQLLTSLMDEIPFGEIQVTSGYGNLITESVFAVGGVDLTTNQGNAIIKNSFAKLFTDLKRYLNQMADINLNQRYKRKIRLAPQKKRTTLLDFPLLH